MLSLNAGTFIQQGAQSQVVVSSYGVFTLEVLTDSPQYKNANIANFVLAVPLEMNKKSEVCNIQM